MNFIGYLKANQNNQSFPETHLPTDGPTKSRMEAGTLPKNILIFDNPIQTTFIRITIIWVTKGEPQHCGILRNKSCDGRRCPDDLS